MHFHSVRSLVVKNLMRFMASNVRGHSRWYYALGWAYRLNRDENGLYVTKGRDKASMTHFYYADVANMMWEALNMSEKKKKWESLASEN